MSENRGAWKLPLIDTVLLLLGSVLLLARGFERAPGYLPGWLPPVDGAGGHAVDDTRSFTVLLGGDGAHVVEDGVVAPGACDEQALEAAARAAFAAGAEVAEVVLSEPGVPAERYLAVLAQVRRAGFQTFRVPVRAGREREDEVGLRERGGAR